MEGRRPPASAPTPTTSPRTAALSSYPEEGAAVSSCESADPTLGPCTVYATARERPRGSRQSAGACQGPPGSAHRQLAAPRPATARSDTGCVRPPQPAERIPPRLRLRSPSPRAVTARTPSATPDTAGTAPTVCAVRPSHPRTRTPRRLPAGSRRPDNCRTARPPCCMRLRPTVRAACSPIPPARPGTGRPPGWRDSVTDRRRVDWRLAARRRRMPAPGMVCPGYRPTIRRSAPPSARGCAPMARDL